MISISNITNLLIMIKASSPKTMFALKTMEEKPKGNQLTQLHLIKCHENGGGEMTCPFHSSLYRT